MALFGHSFVKYVLGSKLWATSKVGNVHPLETGFF